MKILQSVQRADVKSRVNIDACQGFGMHGGCGTTAACLEYIKQRTYFTQREVRRGPLEHVVLHSEAFPRQCEEYGCVFGQNDGLSSTK
jgi:hypothetical protein